MAVHTHEAPFVSWFVSWFLRLVLVWFLIAVPVLSDTGRPFFVGGALVLSWFLFAAGWCSGVLLLLEHRLRLGRAAVARQTIVVYLVILSLIVLGALLAYTHSMVWLRLKVSEPALRAVVHQHHYARGSEPATRAGLFPIVRTEQRADVVWLVTRTCGVGDECGFVYSPGGKPPTIIEDSYRHLDGPWWIWTRSW